jgi:hypothetical protein
MDRNHHLRFTKESSERIKALSLQVQQGSSSAINLIKLTNSASIQKTPCREIVLSKACRLAQASAIG